MSWNKYAVSLASPDLSLIRRPRSESTFSVDVLNAPRFSTAMGSNRYVEESDEYFSVFWSPLLLLLLLSSSSSSSSSSSLMSVGEMSTADVRNVKATAGSSTITFFRLHTKLCVQVNESGNHRRQCRLIRSPVSSQRIISTCHQVSRGPFFLRSDFRQVVCMTYTAAAGGGGHNFIRTGKVPSTPATMSKQQATLSKPRSTLSKQHSTLSKESFDL